MDKATNWVRQQPLVGGCRATFYTNNEAETIIHGTERQVYMTALIWVKQTSRMRPPNARDMLVANYLTNMFTISLYMYRHYGADSYACLNYTSLFHDQ